MIKKLSIFSILNLFFLSIVCADTISFDDGNGYTTISGIIKEVDYDNKIITVLSKVKKGAAKEIHIEIFSGTCSIFVRNIDSLLSIGNITMLLPDDDISIKLRKRKGGYEAIEIEKRENVKNDFS